MRAALLVVAMCGVASGQGKFFNDINFGMTLHDSDPGLRPWTLRYDLIRDDFQHSVGLEITGIIKPDISADMGWIITEQTAPQYNLDWLAFQTAIESNLYHQQRLSVGIASATKSSTLDRWWHTIVSFDLQAISIGISGPWGPFYPFLGAKADVVGSGYAIPEPASLVLGCGSLLFVLWRTGRRKRW